MEADSPWATFIARYRTGEWRDRIFHDMVMADAQRQGPKPTILDIGCGEGLDGDIPLQRSLAAIAGRFIGIEPDFDVSLGDYFTESHRCLLESSPLEAGSVDVAYAVMVLEHLRHPQAFWGKLHQVLADGGVFWGMTVDARHLFCRLSLWAGRLRIKDLYFKRVLAQTPEEARYRNYTTYYRCNTPHQIGRLALGFRRLECINFSRVGQWGDYLPGHLRTIADGIDRRAIRKGRPGSLLIIRAEK
jgi:SAM-dependent methyltransferase